MAVDFCRISRIVGRTWPTTIRESRPLRIERRSCCTIEHRLNAP